MEQPENDTITFSLTPKFLISVVLPITFVVGAAVGYFYAQSQSAPEPEAAVSVPEAALPEGDTSSEQTADDSQPDAPQSVADQIEALPRHEINLEELDPILGPEDAPILIIEFSDFECPFCQRHFQEVYPRLQSTYPDQIRYAFLDFPLTGIHPNAFAAAEAALCAFEQDAFWPYHDLLFGGSLGFSRSSYESYANSLGLDAASFATCLDEERYSEEVRSDMELGFDIGVGSTPTFFINGIGLVGAQPFEVFSEIIDYELERVSAEEN